jgi:hypothetical protein
MFLNYLFYVCFLLLYILLSIFCVLFFGIILCIVSPHMYGCLFSICVQFYQLLPLGANPIAVNKCCIIYYIILKWLTVIYQNL